MTSNNQTSAAPIAINYHLFKPCNYRCRFCFATFRDVRGMVSTSDAKRLIDLLRQAGGQKLNFVGGEPTLHPDIGELVRHAKEVGFTTSIVTNGARLDELIERYGTHLNWVGLSVDSGQEVTQAALGRGKGGHVAASVAHAQRSHAAGIRIKLNTVVTAATWQENMSWLVRAMRPERWKVFQVLPITGQNDGSVEDLLISAEQFHTFVARHQHLKDEGIAVIAEDNDAMLDSYAMIDPLGRFFGNHGNTHVYSQPILEIGVARAVEQVRFSPLKLLARGGLYAWEARTPPTR